MSRQKDAILALLDEINPFNAKAMRAEIADLLARYIPDTEKMQTKMKKYDKVYKELSAENAKLEKALDCASRESIQRRLEIGQKLSKYEDLKRAVDLIPPELLHAATKAAVHKPKER